MSTGSISVQQYLIYLAFVDFVSLDPIEAIETTCGDNAEIINMEHLR